MIQKDRERTKILSLSAGTLLVHQLSDTVAFEGLKFQMIVGGLTLTDGIQFKMNSVAHI
jgi:hypothetical protein